MDADYGNTGTDRRSISDGGFMCAGACVSFLVWDANVRHSFVDGNGVRLRYLQIWYADFCDGSRWWVYHGQVRVSKKRRVWRPALSLIIARCISMSGIYQGGGSVSVQCIMHVNTVSLICVKALPSYFVFY